MNVCKMEVQWATEVCFPYSKIYSETECVKEFVLKTELLAPAKDKQTAIEAINCGADAVYIGASSFGARHNACNSIEDIKEVVNYAHKFWAKVFVTVNTILTDSELDEAVELVKELDNVGVDAVLIQDMGLLSKIIELRLPILIHASTQCDNRDIEKIKFFNKLGLSRIVLARELSLEEIEARHKQNPNLELEAFVHGSLCVSYSGQCYLSQYIGGRSANRGECAQPCRKHYKVFDENNKEYISPYPLCLKDFNASGNLKKMIDSGVYSFKIEGRLKDVGYVKNAVSYYRQLLDKYSEKSSSGRCLYHFIPDVERSFNRGFTDYFLNGRGDCFNPISPKSRGKYLGVVKSANTKSILVETGMEVNPQDGLCFIDNNEFDGFLVNRAEKTKGGYIIYPNKNLKLKNGTKIYRNLDTEFEKELLKPVKRQIGVRVNVSNGHLELTDEDGISVLFTLPNGETAKNQQKMNETFIKQFSKTGDSDFYIEGININSDIPFMPLSHINELRRNAFDELMQLRLSQYKREVQKPLKYVQYYKKEVDYRGNVHNKEAKNFYEKCGAVVNEFSLESKLPNRQVELMRTKHCIKYALNMCKSSKCLYLVDEKGIKYPLKFDCKNCEMILLSPENH